MFLSAIAAFDADVAMLIIAMLLLPRHYHRH